MAKSHHTSERLPSTSSCARCTSAHGHEHHHADEMVKKALHAEFVAEDGFGEPTGKSIRAALEVVADDIIEACAVKATEFEYNQKVSQTADRIRSLKSKL